MIGRRRHVGRWLSDWIEGTLPPSQRKIVEQHLAYCPRCRWQAESLRATLRWLDALEDVPPPPDLATAVRHRLQAVGLPVPSGAARPGTRGLVYRFAVPVAAAGMVLAMVWAMSRGLGDGSGPWGGWARISSAPLAVESMPGDAALASGDAVHRPGSESPGTAPLRDDARVVRPPAAQPLEQPAGRLRTRTGRLELAVADVAGVDAAMEAVVRRFGGFVQGRQQDGTGASATVLVTFRVPDQNLEAVLDALAQSAPGGSVVAGAAIDTDDISMEYEAARRQLEGLRRRQEQLRSEEGSRSLGVEEERARLEREIQGLEQQLRSWDHLMHMATVRVLIRATNAGS